MIELLVKLVARIGLPYKRKVMRSELSMLGSICRKGDLIFTYSPWKLSNIFIRGDYKHVAMYLNSHSIIEATTIEGVSIADIEHLLSKASKYAVYRTNLSNEQCDILENVSYDLADDSIEYDYDLDKSNKKYYCSELIYFIYSHIGNYIKFAGTYLTPSDIYDAVNWGKVYEKQYSRWNGNSAII